MESLILVSKKDMEDINDKLVEMMVNLEGFELGQISDIEPIKQNVLSSLEMIKGITDKG